jgi:hypothetical protein
MSTPDRQALIDQGAAHLGAYASVEALWLAGSLGRANSKTPCAGAC